MVSNHRRVLALDDTTLAAAKSAVHVDQRQQACDLSANQHGNDLTSHEPPNAVVDSQPGTDAFCVPCGDTFHASILSRRVVTARYVSSEYVPRSRFGQMQ